MRKTPIVLVMLALTACAAAPVTDAPGVGEPMPSPPPPTETALPPTATPAVSAGQSEDTPLGTVLFIISERFSYAEYAQPEAAVRQAGYSTVVAADTLGAISAASYPGTTVQEVEAALRWEDVVVSDYDAVVFAGGVSIARHDPVAQRIAQDAASHQKVLAAICRGAEIPLQAGALEGIEVAGPGAACSGGAICTDNSVHRDGSMITALHPEDVGDFAAAIIEALQEASP